MNAVSRNLLFSPTSRYYTIDTASLEIDGGPEGVFEIVYLKRRFLPPTESFALLREHTVEEGDRLDNITARYLGDPLQFWRICDANNAMNPTGLTAEVGRRLRITLPEGLPEIPNVAG
jgi:hypothetical protein